MNLNRCIAKLLIVGLFYLCACSSYQNELDKPNTAPQGPSWPITSYNFGGLEELSPEAQIDMLHRFGYDGIILKCASKEDFEHLDQHLKAAEKRDDFSIHAVFERYNFDDLEERRERWIKVVDKIAGKNMQLWVIFGKKVDGITDIFIENKLREMVAYASRKGVEVILYPHSDCYVESVDEALPFVDKINHPNLNLAFHLYHEIRAGNGSKLEDVLMAVKHRLGAVTLAGTDSTADYSSPLARDTSTIKPIGKGNYNLQDFVEILAQSGYKGSVGFMNFKINGSPQNYLPESLKRWEGYVRP